MTPTVLEGAWEEVAQQAHRFAHHRVRVMILPDEPTTASDEYTPPPASQAFFGMFRGTTEPSDEDFRSAELHGDDDDGLDWS